MYIKNKETNPTLFCSKFNSLMMLAANWYNELIVSILFTLNNLDVKNFKWKTVLALSLAAIAIWFNQYWMWAILFIYWLVPDVVSGQTFFVEDINRKDNPILYWAIIATWLFLAAYTAKWSLNSFWAFNNNSAQTTNAPVNTENNSENNLLYSLVQQNMEYKTEAINEEYSYIGLEQEISFNSNYENEIKQAWNAFFRTDISKDIEGIENYKVYAIYHSYTSTKCKFLLGYRIKANGKSNSEKLTKLTVKPTKYAVIDAPKTGNKQTFIENTWTQIFNSNIPRNNSIDMEVYEFNMRNYSIESASIWLSIN